MPVDHTIYFRQQAPDILGNVQKGLSLRDMVDRRNMQQAEMQKQNQVRNIYARNTQQNPDGSVSLNKGRTLAELYQVDPKLAAEQDLQFRKQQQAEQAQKFQEEKFKADQKYRQSEMNLKEKLANKTRATNTGKLATDLRKERSGLPTTRNTQSVSAAYNKVQESARRPTAAGDLSMIFNYMKMLDPGSVVREGEFATAQNAAGVPDRVANAYNNALRGVRLSPRQRKDFLQSAGGVYKAQLDIQKQIDRQYRSLSEKSGVDPNDVILNFNANPVAPDSKPQTVIQNGVTYTLNPQTGEYE